MAYCCWGCDCSIAAAASAATTSTSLLPLWLPRSMGSSSRPPHTPSPLPLLLLLRVGETGPCGTHVVPAGEKGVNQASCVSRSASDLSITSIQSEHSCPHDAAAARPRSGRSRREDSLRALIDITHTLCAAGRSRVGSIVQSLMPVGCSDATGPCGSSHRCPPCLALSRSRPLARRAAPPAGSSSPPPPASPSPSFFSACLRPRSSVRSHLVHTTNPQVVRCLLPRAVLLAAAGRPAAAAGVRAARGWRGRGGGGYLSAFLLQGRQQEGSKRCLRFWPAS